MSLRDDLDEIDLQILRRLQVDGRTTHADLGREVGLSAPAVLQRVRKLEDSQILHDVVARLDPDRAGFGIQAFIQITLALHDDQAIDKFRKALRSLDAIVEAHHVSGGFDFLLKVAVEDMRAYERFIREELSKVKGIAKIESNFVMGSPKPFGRLPL